MFTVVVGLLSAVVLKLWPARPSGVAREAIFHWKENLTL